MERGKRFLTFKDTNDFISNYVESFLIDAMINDEFRKNVLSSMDFYRLGLYSAMIAFTEDSKQVSLAKQYLYEVYSSGIGLIQSMETSADLDKKYEELGMERKTLIYTRFISMSFYVRIGDLEKKLQKAYLKWQEEKNKITKPGSY